MKNTFFTKENVSSESITDINNGEIRLISDKGTKKMINKLLASMGYQGEFDVINRRTLWKKNNRIYEIDHTRNCIKRMI